MINQFYMIGVIKEMPKEDNSFVLEVRRSYKDSEGVYKKDYFKCHLWIAISKRITSICREGDLVAVKGRLMDDEGVCNIVCEQVILLNKTLLYS